MPMRRRIPATGTTEPKPSSKAGRPLWTIATLCGRGGRGGLTGLTEAVSTLEATSSR